MRADERTYHGIYQHHVRRQPTGGGTVVRPCYADGTAHDQYNYGGLVPDKIYKNEYAADKYVDKLYKERMT